MGFLSREVWTEASLCPVDKQQHLGTRGPVKLADGRAQGKECDKGSGGIPAKEKQEIRVWSTSSVIQHGGRDMSVKEDV